MRTRNKKAGKIVLEPATVRVERYCDCGKLGQARLTGRGKRKTVIRLERRAPHETLVDVVCSYSTTHDWKDVTGHVVRTEVVPCVSNGHFELQLYERMTGFFSP